MKSIERYIKDLSLNAALESNYSTKTEYYSFGCEYFGPLLYGFTDWLWKETSPYPTEKVFFFARDGYMMEKAYSLFNKKHSVTAEYVYFSRNSIRQSLLFYCSTYADSLKYLSPEKFVTFGKILEYYGFSDVERNRISKEENIQNNKEYNYNNLNKNKEIEFIYNKYKNIIDAKSIDRAEILKKYLQQINMEGQCSIVDIGWHGGMQYYLERFIEQNDLNISLKGYYMGIAPTFELKGIVKGYLYSKKEDKLRKRVLCFLGGYEKLFQSLEGSTSGYKYGTENNVIPMLCEYEYMDNDLAKNCIHQWQDGAIEFVKYALRNNATLCDLKDWAMPIIRLGERPSLKDVQLFSFFYNTDGSKEYFISQKSLFKYTPKELIYTLSNSPWKTGFLKSIFKLPLPYHLLYRLMRK